MRMSGVGEDFSLRCLKNVFGRGWLGDAVGGFLGVLVILRFSRKIFV